MSMSIVQQAFARMVSPPWKAASAVMELWNHTKAGRTLKVSRYTIESERLPEAFDSFRIVQLSDIHGRTFGRHQHQLLDAVRALEPDLVVCTGDMYEETDEIHLRRIHDLMAGLAEEWPTYAILGNHEIKNGALDTVIPDMQSCGVRLLRNQAAVLKKDGQVMGIAGIDTNVQGNSFFREDEKQLSERLRHTFSRYRKDVVPFVILLAHCPEMLDVYSRYGVDVVYSGHAHGGLLELPLIHKRLLAPGQGLFPKYTEGVYTEGKTRMVLSTGLGGPRYRLQPEIVCTIFKCKPK